MEEDRCKAINLTFYYDSYVQYHFEAEFILFFISSMSKS